MIAALCFLMLTPAVQDVNTVDLAAQLRKAERRYASLDRRERAITLFREVCEADPDDPLRWGHVARFLVEQRDFEHGEFFAEKALGLSPERPSCHSMLGTCWLFGGRSLDAERLFREAVESFPGSSSLLFNLGVACGQNRRMQEAQVHYEAALRLAPRNPMYVYRAGENAHLMNQLEVAERYFREALGLSPPHPDARWHLGQILGYQERDEEAEQAFRTALQAPPGQRSSRRASYEFGVFLCSRGRFDEALEHVDAVLEEDAKHRMAWQYRARCLRALGRKEEAEAARGRYKTLQSAADDLEEQALLQSILREQIGAEEGGATDPGDSSSGDDG